MYKEFVKFVKRIRSPFWFTLILGAFGVILPIWKLSNKVPNFPYHLGLGLVIGLALGFGVSMLERSLYLRSGRKKGNHSLYKTTSIPNYIFLCIIFLLLLANSKGELGYGTTIMIAGGVYLLSLSMVIFRIRNNKQIIIS